ncbi:hypothetical protein DDG31_09760 [Neisseria gonorrhoeae]
MKWCLWVKTITESCPRLQRPKIPSFPRKWESRPVGAETCRIKRFLRFHVLDSRLRGNDGMQVSVRMYSDSLLRGNDGIFKCPNAANAA